MEIGKRSKKQNSSWWLRPAILCLIRLTKNIMRKRKKRLGFRVKIQVIKSAILISFYKVARPQIFLILNKQCCTIQLISTEAGNKVRWELKLYLKILKILKGQIMWLSLHFYQEIINEQLLDFETTLWSSATDFEKTQISSKRAFSVYKTKRIQITTNKNKLHIYTYLYTKYIKSYTTHTYELPEFSSKIGFPGNSIFKSSNGLQPWLICQATLFDTSLLKPRTTQQPYSTNVSCIGP